MHVYIIYLLYFLEKYKKLNFCKVVNSHALPACIVAGTSLPRISNTAAMLRNPVAACKKFV